MNKKDEYNKYKEDNSFNSASDSEEEKRQEADFEENIRQEADKAYESQMKDIEDQLEKEIIFALIGDVNAGKSSTVNQLMGDEVAIVSGKPGETVEVEEYTAKTNNKLIFADTPGLHDIISDNSEETLAFFKRADVNLFLLNAAGTVFSESEKQVFDKLAKINNNIIFVLNKIDASDDVESQIAYIKEHTKNKYDVVPISSRTGENIDKLNFAILDVLNKVGKDISFAQKTKKKSSIANRWITATGVSAGAVGAMPVPGSDIVPLTSLQIGLMLKLATLYEKPLSKEDAKDLVVVAVTGSIGKSLFRQVIKFIPGAGMVAGAGVASIMTFAFGYAVKYAYENDIEINKKTLEPIYEMFLNRETKKASEKDSDDK